MHGQEGRHHHITWHPYEVRVSTAASAGPKQEAEALETGEADRSQGTPDATNVQWALCHTTLSWALQVSGSLVLYTPNGDTYKTELVTTAALSWRRKLATHSSILPQRFLRTEEPAVHRVAQTWTRLKRLSMHACIGEGNGNPVQCSCLENPRDRGA